MAGNVSESENRNLSLMHSEYSVSDQHDLQNELRQEYALRFGGQSQYRNAVWKVLTADFFQRFVSRDATLLDLGCGWGEFVNNIKAKKKYGMDLNPETAERLADDIQLLEQDCSQRWPLASTSLDCVFTSNFLEHLRTKVELRSTLQEAHRCLKPEGILICMGPNIRALSGAYWDFWDHYLPLTERSLAELLELLGFRVQRSIARFLPYQMSRRRPVPVLLLRLYLRLPSLWLLFGRQFLVIARKNATKV